MKTVVSVESRSKDDWLNAKQAVMAAFMYVLGESRVKVLENATGCSISLPFSQAYRAFKLLLEYFNSRKFPVKVRLSVKLDAKAEKVARRGY